jgi:hypothetical protein
VAACEAVARGSGGAWIVTGHRPDQAYRSADQETAGWPVAGGADSADEDNPDAVHLESHKSDVESPDTATGSTAALPAWAMRAGANLRRLPAISESELY